MKAGKDLTHEEIVQAQKSIFENMGFWLGEGAVREVQDAMVEINKGIGTNSYIQPILFSTAELANKASNRDFQEFFVEPKNYKIVPFEDGTFIDHKFTPVYSSDPKITEEYINDIIEICKQLDKP